MNPAEEDFSDLRAAIAGSHEALLEFWLFLDAHFEAIQAEMQSLTSRLPSFSKITPVAKSIFQDAAVLEERRATYRKAVLEGDWRPYQHFIHATGKQFAQKGMDFEECTSLLFNQRRQIVRRLKRELANDPRRMELARDGLELFMAMGLAFLGDGYLLAKQDIIRGQQQAILELSTPVLQIRERLLVLPLIGHLDTDRIRQATSAMLDSIRKHRALVVILDVTGVPTFNPEVARYFVESADAARLMGTAVLFTGISAVVAGILTGLGTDLEKIKTFSTLQAGLEEADGLLHSRTSSRPS